MTIENQQFADNSTQSSKLSPAGKPITLRLIFISNALMVIFLIGYSIASALGGVESSIATSKIAIAAGVYFVSFALMVKSILGKNINRLRTIIAVNFALALLAQFYIAAIIAVASMALSFHHKVKRFFGVLS